MVMIVKSFFKQLLYYFRYFFLSALFGLPVFALIYLLLSSSVPDLMIVYLIMALFLFFIMSIVMYTSILNHELEL